MGINELLMAKREEILRIAAKHGARNVRIFGSVARGEARPDSDVDLLVELEDGRSLMDLVGLKLDLEDLLGREVDVAEPEGVHWYIRERVLQESVPLKTAMPKWTGGAWLPSATFLFTTIWASSSNAFGKSSSASWCRSNEPSTRCCKS